MYPFCVARHRSWLLQVLCFGLLAIATTNGYIAFFLRRAAGAADLSPGTALALRWCARLQIRSFMGLQGFWPGRRGAPI